MSEAKPTRPRFSKALALQVLDAKVAAIAKREGFDRGNGTAQLSPKDRAFDADIARAVEYGRMRAFEQFAESIEEGFIFEAVATGEQA
jgi:hypothetical protein